MRRRWNLLLTLLFLMLVLLCGAGAYFTDQQQASIRAGAASMGFSVSKPEYGQIPKEIEKDSRLTIQFEVRNDSSVPVYLTAQDVLYVNGVQDETNRVRLERTEASSEFGETSSEGTDTAAVLRLQAGETRTLYYSLSFPGAETLPEGLLAVQGRIELYAATSADGKSGFTYGPVTAKLDLTDGELQIPARSREILLQEYVEAGSHPYEEVRWYRAENIDGGVIHGPDMEWRVFDATVPMKIQEVVPRYVRYELIAMGGVVRSPVYEIILSHGSIQAMGYDFFDGRVVASDVSVSKETR